MKYLEKHYKNISITELLETIDNENFQWIAKRLSGNDTNLTGGHQVGIYLPKYFFRRIFPEICTIEKHNPDTYINECFFPSDDYYVETIRAIYYNSKFYKKQKNGRDEFRLTGWGGRKAPNQVEENTGSIIIIAVKKQENQKRIALCWVAHSVEEETLIESWIGNEVEPGCFYSSEEEKNAKQIKYNLPLSWFDSFPTGKQIFEKVVEYIPKMKWNKSLDLLLLARRNLEFCIFKELEKNEVLPHIKKGFSKVDDFITYANSITNRRKSRTGTSLELNLENIFLDEKLNFETQVRTELRKKPDFIFPSSMAYHSKEFSLENLHMLAAKTCCKDRWRQVVKEADRIKIKHLFTLQEGVSQNQLREMYDSNIVLVVPKPNINSFPVEYKEKILNLEEFVSFIKNTQC